MLRGYKTLPNGERVRLRVSELNGKFYLAHDEYCTVRPGEARVDLHMEDGTHVEGTVYEETYSQRWEGVL